MSNTPFTGIELKSISGQISLDKAQGIVECFVAGIGNKDSVGDIIIHGAFTETLKRRKPRVVWGHNWNDPIGKVLEIYEVGPNDPRLPDKMRRAGIGGLYAKVQFNLNAEKGREAFSNISFYGEEQEWSIGYKTLNATFDTTRQANVLSEVELYEVSPVLHGANQLTGTISIKAADAPLKDPDGGLTAAGRKFYERTEGANLKPGVKGPADTPEKMRRKGSFLTRFFTNPSGPMKDGKGRSTRLALSAAAWGEPVPQDVGDASKLAEKGRRLLDRYDRLKGKSLDDYCEHFLDGIEGKCDCMNGDNDDMSFTVPLRRQETKPEYEDEDIFSEGLARDLSAPELARIQMEMMGRTSKPLRVMRATDNLIWFSMGSDMFMLPYHHEINTDQFMFGKPQRVNDSRPSAAPAPRRMFPSVPSEPGMDDVLQVIGKNNYEDFDMYEDDRKSLFDSSIETLDHLLDEELKKSAIPSVETIEKLRSIVDLIDEMTPRPVVRKEMLIKCSIKDAYSVKSALDPIFEYHGAIAKATENGIAVFAHDSQEFNDAINMAMKALGQRIGRGGRGALRSATQGFDPNAIDGDEDGLVQDSTAFERPDMPRVPKGKPTSGSTGKPVAGLASGSTPKPRDLNDFIDSFGAEPDAKNESQYARWQGARRGWLMQREIDELTKRQKPFTGSSGNDAKQRETALRNLRERFTGEQAAKLFKAKNPAKFAEEFDRGFGDGEFEAGRSTSKRGLASMSGGSPASQLDSIIQRIEDARKKKKKKLDRSDDSGYMDQIVKEFEDEIADLDDGELEDLLFELKDKRKSLRTWAQNGNLTSDEVMSRDINEVIKALIDNYRMEKGEARSEAKQMLDDSDYFVAVDEVMSEIIGNVEERVTPSDGKRGLASMSGYSDRRTRWTDALTDSRDNGKPITVSGKFNIVDENGDTTKNIKTTLRDVVSGYGDEGSFHYFRSDGKRYIIHEDDISSVKPSSSTGRGLASMKPSGSWRGPAGGRERELAREQRDRKIFENMAKEEERRKKDIYPILEDAMKNKKPFDLTGDAMDVATNTRKIENLKGMYVVNQEDHYLILDSDPNGQGQYVMPYYHIDKIGLASGKASKVTSGNTTGDKELDNDLSFVGEWIHDNMDNPTDQSLGEFLAEQNDMTYDELIKKYGKRPIFDYSINSSEDYVETERPSRDSEGAGYNNITVEIEDNNGKVVATVRSSGEDGDISGDSKKQISRILMADAAKDPGRGLASRGDNAREKATLDLFLRTKYEDYVARAESNGNKPESYQKWYKARGAQVEENFYMDQRRQEAKKNAGLASRRSTPVGRDLGKSREFDIDSSAADYVRYDAVNEELTVTYKGGKTYTYGGITGSMADEAENAPSLGRALNDIKRNAQYTLRPDGTVNGDQPSLAKRLGNHRNRLEKSRGLDQEESDVFDLADGMAQGDFSGSDKEAIDAIQRIERVSNKLRADDEWAAAIHLDEAARHAKPTSGLASRIGAHPNGKMDYDLSEAQVGGIRNGLKDAMKRQSRNRTITQSFQMFDDKLAASKDGKLSLSAAEYETIMDGFGSLEQIEPDGHGLRRARSILELGAVDENGKYNSPSKNRARTGMVTAEDKLDVPDNNGAPIDITPREQGELIKWAENQPNFNAVQKIRDNHRRNNGVLTTGEWMRLENYKNAYGNRGRRGFASSSGDGGGSIPSASGGAIAGAAKNKPGRPVGYSEDSRSKGKKWVDIEPNNWKLMSPEERDEHLFSDLHPNRSGLRKIDWDRLVKENSAEIEKLEARSNLELRRSRRAERMAETKPIEPKPAPSQAPANSKTRRKLRQVEASVTASDAKAQRKIQQTALADTITRASAKAHDAVLENSGDQTHADMWDSLIDMIEESDDLTISDLEAMRDTLDNYLEDIASMELSKADGRSVRTAKTFKSRLDDLLGQYEDDQFIERGDAVASVSTGRESGFASRGKPLTTAQREARDRNLEEQRSRRRNRDTGSTDDSPTVGPTRSQREQLTEQGMRDRPTSGVYRQDAIDKNELEDLNRTGGFASRRRQTEKVRDQILQEFVQRNKLEKELTRKEVNEYKKLITDVTDAVRSNDSDMSRIRGLASSRKDPEIQRLVASYDPDFLEFDDDDNVVLSDIGDDGSVMGLITMSVEEYVKQNEEFIPAGRWLNASLIAMLTRAEGNYPEIAEQLNFALDELDNILDDNYNKDLEARTNFKLVLDLLNKSGKTSFSDYINLRKEYLAKEKRSLEDGGGSPLGGLASSRRNNNKAKKPNYQNPRRERAERNLSEQDRRSAEAAIRRGREYIEASDDEDRPQQRGLASAKAGRMEVPAEFETFKNIYDSLLKEIREAEKANDRDTARALKNLQATMQRQDVVKVSEKMTNARRLLLNQDELDEIMDALMVVVDRQMQNDGSRVAIFGKFIDMLANAGMATFINKNVDEVNSRTQDRQNASGRTVRVNISD